VLCLIFLPRSALFVVLDKSRFLAAIMSLKRKKAYDGQIQNLSGARLTIETQIMAIESATTHFAALSAMQEGARAMKSLNNNMYSSLLSSSGYPRLT